MTGLALMHIHYGIELNPDETRCSVEHCTLHADGARLHFTGLSLLKMLLPGKVYGRGGSSALQSPVTYKFEMVGVKTSFEFVQFFPSSAAILLVVWSAKGDCSVLTCHAVPLRSIYL